MSIKAPKGTKDVLPEEAYRRMKVEDVIRRIFDRYNYDPIRLPVFEHTELFARGVGESSDIVQKEMYTFEDKGGRSITLRPEGTAGVVRSYIENGMASWTSPVKLYYIITAYRYENVQKGRYREFNQIGAEAIGSENPYMDVEVIAMMRMIFDELGLGHVACLINSIGCTKCRPDYRDKLAAYLEPNMDAMCADCRVRSAKNILRVLDCKNEQCQKITKKAPMITESLCDACDRHFEQVKEGLDVLGISYQIDPMIVRGLDYYMRTVFEFVSYHVGTQGTVCGGGRYDQLVESIGGQDQPGVGFAMGVERLFMELEASNVLPVVDRTVALYIASMGDAAKKYAAKITYSLRKQGIKCQNDVSGKSLKAQMKYANKINAEYVVVLGDRELEEGIWKLKNMNTSQEEPVKPDDLAAVLKKLTGQTDR